MPGSKTSFENNIVISISVKTLFYILIGIFLIWIGYMVKNVLIMLFLALILSLALQPFVFWFVKKGWNHALAVVTTVGIFAVVFLGLVSLAIIPFIQQFQVLVIRFPLYLDTLVNGVPAIEASFMDKINTVIIDGLSKTSGGVLNLTLGAFSIMLNVILTLAFSIYMLMDFDSLRNYFLGFIPKVHRDIVKFVIIDLEGKLGEWLRGQVLLMLIVGVFTYIGLTLLGVDYALALAVIAGLLEIVPFIGPIISAVPAVILGFSVSPLVGAGVIGLYILVQQLEGNLIVPKVYQKTTGLNPLVTIIAIMVGGQLFGVIGAILSVPFTIIILEVTKYIVERDNGKEVAK